MSTGLNFKPSKIFKRFSKQEEKRMTQMKTYKYGDLTFKTYFKPVGQGFEVSFYCGAKPYFVGNFVHKKEAQMWWRIFNTEITNFAKKYWCSDETNHQWYCTFMTNHLYKMYYTFLDKMFARYTVNFKKATFKDIKKYNKIKKTMAPSEKYYFQKAA